MGVEFEGKNNIPVEMEERRDNIKGVVEELNDVYLSQKRKGPFDLKVEIEEKENKDPQVELEAKDNSNIVERDSVKGRMESREELDKDSLNFKLENKENI